jgi:hypothetical protein
LSEARTFPAGAVLESITNSLDTGDVLVFARNQDPNVKQNIKIIIPASTLYL